MKTMIFVVASLMVNLAAFADVGPTPAGEINCSEVTQKIEDAKKAVAPSTGSDATSGDAKSGEAN